MLTLILAPVVLLNFQYNVSYTSEVAEHKRFKILSVCLLETVCNSGCPELTIFQPKLPK